MAIEIVDGFETVQINDADGKAAFVRLGFFDCLIELGEESAAVVQPGQGIEIGELVIFPTGGFQLAAGVDCTGKCRNGTKTTRSKVMDTSATSIDMAMKDTRPVEKK